MSAPEQADGQGDLFSVLSDPMTSEVSLHGTARDTEIEAARLVAPRAGTQRMTVLHTIANAGEHGLTDVEIATKTGLYLYSAAPRRHELLDGGWLEDSGERRGTGRGGTAIAWRLTDAGRRALRAEVGAA